MSEQAKTEKLGQAAATAASEQVSRRAFARIAIGAAGVCYAAMLGYPIYRYLASPVEKATKEAAVKEILLKDAHKLAPGAGMIFKFGARPAWLIHHKDGSWIALDAVCTHLGCTVKYEEQNNRIFCECHGGIYDPITGKNIAGPPPRPLKQYRVQVTDSGVIVSRA
ncbi:MAG: ubiquinol-cytochrome c reductase iron-sulfur subunit [Verrucomicrobiia bacterium]|jgi:cytochrome b6-f complex iron-sulfur subunit